MPSRLLSRLGLDWQQQRVRFFIAGGINTCIGLSLFPAILWLSPWFYRNYLAGLVASQIICTMIAFLIQRSFVFKSSSGNLIRELYKFFSFYIFNYAINIGLLPVLVKIGGISPIIAQFGFTLAMIVGSYFWHSHITFKSDSKVR